MNITIENFRVSRRRTDPTLLANCLVMVSCAAEEVTVPLRNNPAYYTVRELPEEEVLGREKLFQTQAGGLRQVDLLPL